MMSLLRWIRGNGESATPDGREGEFDALLVAISILAWFLYTGPGLSVLLEAWVFVLGGAVAGLLYASSYRERALARLPEDLASTTAVSIFAGGFGLSMLELIPATNSILALLFSAATTVLVIYLGRLVSPFHRGLGPQRRGVDPPPALEVDG